MKNKRAEILANNLNTNVIKSEMKLFFREAIKHGLSTAQLAEKMGVTTQTISLWKLGKTIPKSKYITLMSKVLNLDPDKLIDDFYS